MLFPSKHSDPDQTVLAFAVSILQHLRARQTVSFDDLRAFGKKKTKNSELLFTPSLSVLYLLGLVEYLPKVDSFESWRPNMKLKRLYSNNPDVFLPIELIPDCRLSLLKLNVQRTKGSTPITWVKPPWVN